MEKLTPHMPLLGDDFPELTVKTTQGMMNIPGDYKGSWFVLFSHPADFTPVCTTEFHAFQRKFDEFEKLNCKLIGLSVDQFTSHVKWLEWIKEKLGVQIDFPVIAANDTIALQLGMIHPGMGCNTVRAVFIVDPEGKNRLIMYYPQEVGRNIDEVLRSVKALQTADTQGSTPANWPENELMGDRVIVPIPSCINDAEKRLADPGDGIECYDWWLCHKPYKKN